MSAAAPLVSIVVPTRNAARFLEQALESIRAQTYPGWEVVLVDAASTDATLEIAARCEKLRVVAQQGAGLPEAWNLGIEASRGELVALLDSDDLWDPRKLELQVAALADPAVDCAISRMRFVLEPGYPVPRGFKPALLDGDHVAKMPSALLARASVFARIGSFETRWEIASDIEWFARAQDAGLRIALVPEVLVDKRVHDTNLSTLGGAALNRELVTLLRESVARRKAP